MTLLKSSVRVLGPALLCVLATLPSFADEPGGRCAAFLPPAETSSTDRDIQVMSFCGCAITKPLAEVEVSQRNWYAPVVTNGRLLLPGDGANGVFSLISLGVPVQTVDLFAIPRSGDPLAPGRSSYYFDSARALQLTPLPTSSARVKPVENPRSVRAPLSPPQNAMIDDSFKTRVGNSLTSILKFAEKTDGPELLSEIYPVPTGNTDDLKKNLEEAEINVANAKKHVGDRVEELNKLIDELNKSGNGTITYSVNPKGSRKKPLYDNIYQTVNGVVSPATDLEPEYYAQLRTIRDAQQNANEQIQRLAQLRSQMARIDDSKDIEKCRALGRESGQKDWGGFFKALEDQIALSIKAAQEATPSASGGQTNNTSSGR